MDDTPVIFLGKAVYCFDVRNHAKGNDTPVREINMHAKIVMARAGRDIQLFVNRVISSGKPSEKLSDNHRISMTQKQVFGMPADSHLYTSDDFICGTWIIWINLKAN